MNDDVSLLSPRLIRNRFRRIDTSALYTHNRRVRDLISGNRSHEESIDGNNSSIIITTLRNHDRLPQGVANNLPHIGNSRNFR